MYTTINFFDFQDAFKNHGRGNQFTYEGLNALYDYLEEYEEETGESIELDVIAICCEYSEYENLDEFWEDYDKEDYPTLEDIQDETCVIEIEGSDGFIIMCF